MVAMERGPDYVAGEGGDMVEATIGAYRRSARWPLMFWNVVVDPKRKEAVP